MTDQEQFHYLKQEIKNLKGKVFISYVHASLYGPLRNLNFILENPDPSELHKYLKEGWEQIGIDIWKETMMATQPMVMPWEMTLTAEKPPQVFKSIKAAEFHIRTLLKANKSMTEDPFYYRLGIH